jgi:AraC-like DNA-binding protein
MTECLTDKENSASLGPTGESLWTVRIHTYAPLASLPRLLVAASERRISPRYHHEGRFRQRESHFLFKYTLAGEGAFRDGQGEHRVPTGCGFLCEIRDPATAYYYPPTGRAPWEFVYVCLEGGCTAALVRDLLKRHGPVYALPPEHEAVRRMLGFSRFREDACELSGAESAQMALGLLLALAQSREEAAGRDSGDLLVRRAQALVRRRIRDGVNVSVLARELRVSREHLTRVFAARTSLPPHRYIERERTRQACRLLKESILTAKEIAAELGFSSAAQFTRAFRRATGMPPMRFRAVGSVPLA